MSYDLPYVGPNRSGQMSRVVLHRKVFPQICEIHQGNGCATVAPCFDQLILALASLPVVRAESELLTEYWLASAMNIHPT